MTLQQWRNDSNLRPTLAAILAEPAMVAAIAIVYEQGLAPIVCPAGVDLIHYSALMGARKEGYMEALKNLRLLAAIVPNKAAEAKPWSVKETDLPKESFFDSNAPSIPTRESLIKDGLQPAPQPEN